MQKSKYEGRQSENAALQNSKLFSGGSETAFASNYFSPMSGIGFL